MPIEEWDESPNPDETANPVPSEAYYAKNKLEGNDTIPSPSTFERNYKWGYTAANLFTLGKNYDPARRV